MGLTPAMVPEDLRDQIYQKLGLPSSGVEQEPEKKPVLKDAKTLRKLEEKRSKKRQEAKSER